MKPKTELIIMAIFIVGDLTVAATCLFQGEYMIAAGALVVAAALGKAYSDARRKK